MEKESCLELVIFDLDGTLVKLPIDYDKMYSKLRQLFNLKDRVVPLKTVDKLTRGNLGLRRRAFQILTEAEMEALPKIRLNPSLEELREKFKPVDKALVTMQGPEVVNQILPLLKIKFKMVVTREHSLDRAEQLRHVIACLGTQPARVLFIGDRFNDELGARNVGCRFMKIGW